MNSQLYCSRSQLSCEDKAAEAEVEIREKINSTLQQLSAIGVEVVIISGPPRAAFSVPEATAKSMIYTAQDDYLVPLALSHPTAFIAAIAPLEGSYRELIDLEAAFCNGVTCELASNGIPKLFDATHLTARFS